MSNGVEFQDVVIAVLIASGTILVIVLAVVLLPRPI
jgi:hypothetical protein